MQVPLSGCFRLLVYNTLLTRVSLLWAHLRAVFAKLQGYHDVYSLALSLGAKPLLDHTTLQQIALENSHSIASFDCRPQVLEFFHRSTQTNRASPDVACDLGSTTLSKHAHINNDETSSVASTAIAVTVYGQSRDLVSESDPLFFEVGLDAPISVS